MRKAAPFTVSAIIVITIISVALLLGLAIIDSGKKANAASDKPRLSGATIAQGQMKIGFKQAGDRDEYLVVIQLPESQKWSDPLVIMNEPMKISKKDIDAMRLK